MLDKVLSKCVESINLVHIVICNITENIEDNPDVISYKQDYHDQLRNLVGIGYD